MSHMLIRFAAVLAVVIAPQMGRALVDPPVGMQERFRTRATGVRIDALVTDGRRPIGGLTAADFVLTDNGVLQEISRIDTEELPLHLLVVLDTSASISGAKRDRVIEAGRAVVDAIDAKDRVSVVALSHRLFLVDDSSPSHSVAREALSQLVPFGSTALNDAVLAALLLRSDSQSRCLLIVLSDDRDTASWFGPATVLDLAEATDVVAYGVSVATVFQPLSGQEITRLRRRQQPETDIWLAQGHFMDALAQVSGGRVIHTSWSHDLARTFGDILNEFRVRYVLSYTPSVAAAGWHDVEVRLKSRSGKVTARRGYFVDR